MSGDLSKLVGRTAKAVARQAKGVSLVAVRVQMPGGEHGLAWAVDGATAEDIEALAYALIDRAHDRSAGQALECDGCADRMARTRAALTALRPAQAVMPKHTHQ